MNEKEEMILSGFSFLLCLSTQTDSRCYGSLLLCVHTTGVIVVNSETTLFCFPCDRISIELGSDFKARLVTSRAIVQNILFGTPVNYFKGAKKKRIQGI